MLNPCKLTPAGVWVRNYNRRYRAMTERAVAATSIPSTEMHPTQTRHKLDTSQTLAMLFDSSGFEGASAIPTTTTIRLTKTPTPRRIVIADVIDEPSRCNFIAKPFRFSHSARTRPSNCLRPVRELAEINPAYRKQPIYAIIAQNLAKVKRLDVNQF